MKTLHLITPGLTPYGDALAMQLHLRERIAALPLAQQTEGYLLCLEHPPVITLGKRGVESALLDPTHLTREGIEVYKTDRGGEATYHEPGQLVVYPILPIRSMDLGVVDLIRHMAECMAECVRPYGAEVDYDKDVPGLWTKKESERGGRAKKMASVGMRVSRGVTTHGIAINLINPMRGFKLIVPCGMPNTPFCNLLDFMGEEAPASKEIQGVLFSDIQSDFCTRFSHYLDVPLAMGGQLDWGEARRAHEVTPMQLNRSEC